MTKWKVIGYLTFHELLNALIPGVMKTGSANLNFCATFHNFPCLRSACLLCCSWLISVFLVFLACFLVRDMFSSGCRHNYPFPAPYPPRPAPMFFVPTHNSFFNTSDSELFEISARLKLVQSLNSPFFPPHIGAEPGRAKEESRITCMRMLRTNQ